MKPEEIQEYLLRSYTAVDGLWFMKIEEKYGFDAALEMDAAVWAVMPKIQARQLRVMMAEEGGIQSLRRCYARKLELEKFVFEISDTPEGFEVRITGCPWYEKLLRSNRAHLAEKIGSRICSTEYSVWAAEFGCSFRFSGDEKICAGGKSCVLCFEK
ncbi:hypothetical protein JW906_08095 [bacterium]|nr:hypothetical protein [bacterium]